MILETLSIEIIQNIRWAIAGMIGALIAISIGIVISYVKQMNRLPSRALPWHIFLVGTSYIIFAGVAAADNVRRNIYKYPVEWWIIFPRVAATVLGVFAMIAMILHLRYEQNTGNNVFDKNQKCKECGSHFVSRFCASCGASQKANKS